MRGGVLLFCLSLLVLSACVEVEPVDFSQSGELNRIYIIDFPHERVEPIEREILQRAYENENRALALHRKAVDLYPNDLPFQGILISIDFDVGLHEEAFNKYELTAPEYNWYQNVTEFKNPIEACNAAAGFAQESLLLYDEWLSNRQLDNQDIRFILETSAGKYENTYLPTYKRCGRGFYS